MILRKDEEERELLICDALIDAYALIDAANHYLEHGGSICEITATMEDFSGWLATYKAPLCEHLDYLKRVTNVDFMI